MYKVYIRPLTIEDAKISYQWRNDPEVWKFTGSKPDREITYEIEKEWIEKVISDKTCRRFAIIADGNYIGNIQLTNIKNKEAEYHIFIGDKSWWGKGISTLATYQILHFAKEELQLEEVLLSVREENIAAIKSYLKCSFSERESENGWIKMVCVLEQLPEPMVSVFVMVYNHEKYLHECLDGILMQKCNFPFNIVVGEDCSTDRSQEILVKYNESYPGKFKLLLHEKNIGAVANQNTVFSGCTGKYIAICEGDDYWTDPLKLQKQLDFLEANPDFSICFHAVEEVSENNSHHQILKTFPTEKEYTIEDLAKENFIHTPSVIFRNNMKTLPAWIHYSPIGDYPLHMLNAQFGKIKYFPQKMAAYRIGSGVWTNLHLSERIVNTLFTLKLLKDYFTAVNKPVADLLQEQHLYLLKKLQNIDDKDKIITSFLSETKEVEIRMTAKKLFEVVVYKMMRKLKLS